MNMEKAKSILVVTLSVFLAAATVFGSAAVLKQLGFFKPPTTIVISGSGKEAYKPDLAEVSVSVITKEKDSGTAQSKNDEKMAKIIVYLKDAGVKEEDIKTTSYNLYPEYRQGKEVLPLGSGATSSGAPARYDYPNPNTFEIIGYTLDQSLVFKIREIAKVGAVIGGLSDKGISQISGVNFSLSDEKLEELKTKAKEKAVAKAKKELETTKILYGFRKAKLLSISDYPVYPGPIYRDAKALGIGGGETSLNVSPIQVGEGELEVQVSLTYELR